MLPGVHTAPPLTASPAGQWAGVLDRMQVPSPWALLSPTGVSKAGPVTSDKLVVPEGSSTWRAEKGGQADTRPTDEHRIHENGSGRRRERGSLGRRGEGLWMEVCFSV